MNRFQPGAAPGVALAMAMATTAALLSPTHGFAQAIHKCVADGQVTYQSMPCARDDQVVHVWQSTPSASDAAAASARVQAAKAVVAKDVPVSTSSAKAAAAPVAASEPSGPRHHR